MANKTIGDFTEDTAPGHNDWVETQSAAGNSRKVKRKNFLRQSVSLEVMRPLTDFSQINISGANSVVESSGKAVTVSTNTLAATVSLVGLRRAAPGTTPYRVAVFVQPNFSPVQYEVLQFGFSDGTKYETVALGAGGTEVDTWTTSTARASATGITGGSTIILGNGFWLGMRDDGTNVHWEVSADGVNFGTVRRIAKSSGYLGQAAIPTCLLDTCPTTAARPATK